MSRRRSDGIAYDLGHYEQMVLCKALSGEPLIGQEAVAARLLEREFNRPDATMTVVLHMDDED